MKVRWTATSLRLRITPTELSCLQSGATATERCELPGGWSVDLRVGEATALSSPEPGGLTLTLSAAALAELSDPTREGVYFEGDGLRYYVEKDFPCEHPRPAEAQEKTETFARPH